MPRTHHLSVRSSAVGAFARGLVGNVTRWASSAHLVYGPGTAAALHLLSRKEPS